MYVPAHFAAPESLIAELAPHRLSILITQTDEEGLIATHIPMLWNEAARTLEGHVARANIHHKTKATRALVIIPGPEAYVSPSLYASKAEHGRVVPTWNYEAIHAYGALTWFEDEARLIEQVRALSDRHEAARVAPWSLSDAPADYVERLARAIVGVAISVERIEAKQKLSQNKSSADKAGIIAGLGDVEIAHRMRRLTET